MFFAKGFINRVSFFLALFALGKGNEPLLVIENLSVEIVATGNPILRHFNLTVNENESHAIMGPNGSGKSTLAKVIMGHPDYRITEGSIIFQGIDITSLPTHERAQSGLFLAFQSPQEIANVSNEDFLMLMLNTKRKQEKLPELDIVQFTAQITPLLSRLDIPESFLDRSLNEGSSGGERKKNELLHLLLLQPKLAILDETDSGLDIDSVSLAAKVLLDYKKSGGTILAITHYKKVVELLEINKVSQISSGSIRREGDISVAYDIDQYGFRYGDL